MSHPGGNPGANLKSISHRCHLREVAFQRELTKGTIYLPLGCLQGGKLRSFGEWFSVNFLLNRRAGNEDSETEADSFRGGGHGGRLGIFFFFFTLKPRVE